MTSNVRSQRAEALAARLEHANNDLIALTRMASIHESIGDPATPETAQ